MKVDISCAICIIKDIYLFVWQCLINEIHKHKNQTITKFEASAKDIFLCAQGS